MEQPNSEGKRLILLAEDDVMVRNLLRSFLVRNNYAVLVASNGSEASTLSHEYVATIDLFLSDIDMPFLGGIEAYKLISAHRPDLKVIFMSGGHPQTDLPESWAFLPKPVDLNLLKNTVAKILDVSSVHDVNNAAPRVILVVDQQEVRRKRTKSILTGYGYEVLTAVTVEDAEAIAASRRQIDLIISEVIFTGENGVSLAERAESSDRNLKTLLISHFHIDILRKVRGFSLQPEFLPNPFTAKELLDRVVRLLEEQK